MYIYITAYNDECEAAYGETTFEDFTVDTITCASSSCHSVISTYTCRYIRCHSCLYLIILPYGMPRLRVKRRALPSDRDYVFETTVL